jgi:AcrR family transcriptional regulator
MRRDAFVDAAMRLIQTKGYEQTSLQDVLDQAEASRGAFYHYFDSKSGLLDAVIQRMVDTVAANLEPLVADPDIPAIRKLQLFFAGIVEWKEERRGFLAALLDVWLSDENAIVREHLRLRVAERLTPLLTEILAQGEFEGTFSAGPADETARVLISVIVAVNETATRLFLATRDGTATYEDAVRTVTAYAEAMERILGIPTGSWPVPDEASLRFWFAN